MSEKRTLKKLGVIGGMGPAATCFYYDSVIRHTEASCDQEHIDMVILSHATMPDRTRAIETKDEKELLAYFAEDVKTLEKLGVSNIAVPCNTSHYFFDRIQCKTTVPMIHMVRETVKYAVGHYKNVKKIGIMATDGTIETGLYHKECEAFGVIPVNPSKERQKDVMSLIYDDVKQGKKGDYAKFERTMNEFMEMDCDVVILACTELSVFKEEIELPKICLDAMDVLVRESILRSGAQYK